MPAHILRVILTAHMFGQTCQNVMHFSDNEAGVSELTAVQTIVDHWMPEWRGLSHNQCVWDDISVQQVAPFPGIALHRTVNIAGNGNATAAADLPILCYLIKLQTLTVGRRGRGRLYAPGPSIAGGNLGLITAPTIAAVKTKLDNLMVKFGPPPVITNMSLVVCPRKDPGNFHHVVSMDVRGHYSQQRRRNYGVGV